LRRHQTCHFEPLHKSTVNLHFGSRADADTDAERGKACDVAFDFMGEIGLVLLEREASLEEDPSRSDGFGIFGDKRPLLRVCGAGDGHANREDYRFQVPDSRFVDHRFTISAGCREGL
jgi:hypothetical protein